MAYRRGADRGKVAYDGFCMMGVAAGNFGKEPANA